MIEHVSLGIVAIVGTCVNERTSQRKKTTVPKYSVQACIRFAYSSQGKSRSSQVGMDHQRSAGNTYKVRCTGHRNHNHLRKKWRMPLISACCLTDNNQR